MTKVEFWALPSRPAQSPLTHVIRAVDTWAHPVLHRQEQQPTMTFFSMCCTAAPHRIIRVLMVMSYGILRVGMTTDARQQAAMV